MNLQEQIYRSKLLMCESDNDRLSLINNILNDMSLFNDNIQFNAVREFENIDDEKFYFSVEITMDSSMFHEISPNYNIEYKNFIVTINEYIRKITNKYLPPNFNYEVNVFFHKNVETVIKVAKPLLDNAFKVYNQTYYLPILPYEFITVIDKPEIIILIKSNTEIGLKFNHSDFLETLSELYPSNFDSFAMFFFSRGLFGDFYITGSKNNYPKFKTYNVNESVVNNKVICDKCHWSWDLSDGGSDPYTCHKCGQDNLDS